MPVKSLITPASRGGDYEQIPAGVYLARCFRMVDIGTHTTTGQFGTKDQRQIVLTWEILQDDGGEPVFMADGQSVFSISKTYTWSLHERATLRKDVNSWRGKALSEEEAAGFDLSNLVNKFALLQVAHRENEGKTYANVQGLMATKRKAPGVNEDLTFTVADPDLEVMAELPQWMIDKIEDSREWANPSTTSEPTESRKEDEETEDEIASEDLPF